MEYIISILMIIVITYTFLQIRHEYGRWMFAVIICYFVSAGGIIYARATTILHQPFLLICITVMISLSYLFLHIKKNKVTYSFYTMFYLVIGMLFYIGSKMKEHKLLIMVSLIMTLVFFLAENNQRLMRKSYEQSANEYQNKIVKKQVEEVQNIYMTMRGWRHDYHNHIQAVKAYLTLDQTDLAADYLNQLDHDLDSVNQLVESGNVNLDAILNSKLSFALKQEIEVNYKAHLPSSLQVSDIDLCVLIGNLIDNAVEACEKVTDSNRFIRVYIGVFQKQLYLSVTNSTNEIIRKYDEEYITMKRGNHGHGLKRINNIADKYQGYINRKNEPGIFVTEIMLPL